MKQPGMPNSCPFHQAVKEPIVKSLKENAVVSEPFKITPIIKQLVTSEKPINEIVFVPEEFKHQKLKIIQNALIGAILQLGLASEIDQKMNTHHGVKIERKSEDIAKLKIHLLMQCARRSQKFVDIIEQFMYKEHENNILTLRLGEYKKLIESSRKDIDRPENLIKNGLLTAEVIIDGLLGVIAELLAQDDGTVDIEKMISVYDGNTQKVVSDLARESIESITVFQNVFRRGPSLFLMNFNKFGQDTFALDENDKLVVRDKEYFQDAMNTEIEVGDFGNVYNDIAQIQIERDRQTFEQMRDDLLEQKPEGWESKLPLIESLLKILTTPVYANTGCPALYTELFENMIAYVRNDLIESLNSQL